MIDNQDSGSIKKREAFITQYPLFCLLSLDDIHNLALLLKEVFFDVGTLITVEGDIVDNVYIIISGTAKVTRSITTVEKTEIISVAILTNGDAIGLTETGFFSHSGMRTATVTATSPITALALALKDFNKFLQDPGVTYPALKNIGEKIHLMHLLKSAQIFQHLPNEIIKQVVDHLTRISFKSGEYIFKKEEITDKYYFLLSGTIAVIDDNNQKHIILESNLLSQSEDNFKNSDVYAESDCELLMIAYGDLKHLIQVSGTIKQSKSAYLFKKAINFTRKIWK